MKDGGLLQDAWKLLENSIVEYKGKPIGTLAAADKSIKSLNYNQVFLRDFAVSAFAFLLNGRHEIVKNFLEVTIKLQSRVSEMDCFLPAKGTMPASFKVSHAPKGEKLIPDFGGKAIARVAPIDSVFWWLYILRAYVKTTSDWDYARRDDCQESIKLILELSLTNRFDMFPTMLVPDGSFMIDRRMGVYGYPLEIQGLFYTALLCAGELLIQNSGNKIYFENINKRLGHLIYHIRKYYWLDFKKLNQIYRFKIEEYKEHALNQFNIFPESIPPWVFDWLSDDDGYFAGDVGPSRMDFRFFTAGNLLMIINSLADKQQADAILKLLHNREKALIGEMPLKICYPALRGKEWELITGHDPKNMPWSYHNGGSWPFLMWYLAAASVKTGSTGHVSEIIELAGKRLSEDDYPEYYDGIHNRLVGKDARRKQTWSIAGYIIAKTLLNDPIKSEILTFNESPEILGRAESSSKELDY
jgi:Alkaline and neutral invertase